LDRSERSAAVVKPDSLGEGEHSLTSLLGRKTGKASRTGNGFVDLVSVERERLI
jgi:hypothetical protein